MTEERATLIREALILSALIDPCEAISQGDMETCDLILREMRAETEAARLACRIAAHYRIPPPAREVANV